MNRLHSSQKPDGSLPPEDGPLFFKWDFEPHKFILNAPQLDDIEHWLVRHLKVQCDMQTIEYLTSCLCDRQPLQSSRLAEVAASSKITIEERRWLSWSDGRPEEARAIILTRVAEEESGAYSREQEEESLKLFDAAERKLLALHLLCSHKGILEAQLVFPSETLSKNLNEVNERWAVFDELAKEQGYGPFLYDLAQYAQNAEFDPREPLFQCGQVDVCAYPVPTEVTLDYIEEADGDSKHAHVPRADKDPFLTPYPYHQDPTAASAIGYTTETAPAHAEEEPEPGAPVTVINPSAKQLGTIASLSSSWRLPQVLTERLLLHARGIRPVDTATFKQLSAKDLDSISVHTRTRFTLDGEFKQRSFLSLEQATPGTANAVTVELRPLDIDEEGTAPQIEMCVWWSAGTITSPQHWAEILKAADLRQ